MILLFVAYYIRYLASQHFINSDLKSISSHN